jgi:Ca2+/Na+ antiporter
VCISAEFYYSVGTSCVPCPENDFAQYILMFVVFVIACALLYYLLAATSKLTKKRSKKQKQKADGKKKKKLTKKRVKKGSANKGNHIDGTHATTALGALALITTHTQVLAFILPTVVLPALPPEFAEFLLGLSNIFSIDITAFVSSPECIWKLSFSQEYLMKMIMPLLFFAMFFCWAALAWW